MAAKKQKKPKSKKEQYVERVAKRTGWDPDTTRARMTETEQRLGISFKDYSKANLWKVPPEEQAAKFETILNKRENKSYLVIVMTRNYSTGLSVIRSLGSAGFTVDTIAFTPKKGRSEIVSLSKYVRNFVENVSPKYDGAENPAFLETLDSYQDFEGHKILLFPTDDYSLSLITHYRPQLEGRFLFPGAKDASQPLEHYLDKAVQCSLAEEAGFLVPQSHIISLRELPIRIPDDVIYPCFCKPISSYRGLKTEMLRCNNPQELRSHLERVRQSFSDRDFLVQEFVDVEYEIAVEGYSCGDHTLVPGVVRKERVAKWETGVSITGTFLSTDTFPQLAEHVKAFLKHVNYTGLFDMDLMVSKGKVYFTEVNLRSGGLTYVFVKNGVNLPALYVRERLGLQNAPELQEADQFGKNFIYEMMAWEDCINGYMSYEELRRMHEEADVHIIDDEDDQRPYRHYLAAAQKRLKDRQKRIRDLTEYYQLSEADARCVLEAAHQASWSWMKAQREMQAAFEISGIPYEQYLAGHGWEQNLFQEEIMSIESENAVVRTEERDKPQYSAEYLQSRMAKAFACRHAEEQRRRRYEQGSGLEDVFFVSGDRKLTDEERREVRKFWKPFSYAVEPPLRSCRIYTNRSGIFSPAYVSAGMQGDILRWSCPDQYREMLQDRSILGKAFFRARLPRTLARFVQNVYLDGEWNELTEDACLDLCMEQIEAGRELVLRVSSLEVGGESSRFLKDVSRSALQKTFRRVKADFVIQESIQHHPVMRHFNESSSNLLRLTTLLWAQKVELLAGLVRVGSPGSRLSKGGSIIGVTADGHTLSWALTCPNQRVETLPSGLSLAEPVEIPFFGEAVDMVRKCHMEYPQIKLLSWDVAITEQGPLIVSCSCDVDVRLHQSVTGPLFGDRSEEVLKNVFRLSFFRERSDMDYDYREFHSFVGIEKYVNNEETVIIPASVNGKPIRRIYPQAFMWKGNVRRIVIPEGVRIIEREAFRGCANLEEVVLPESLKVIGRSAFRNCLRLSSINLSDEVEVRDNAFTGCKQLKRKLRERQESLEQVDQMDHQESLEQMNQMDQLGREE